MVRHGMTNRRIAERMKVSLDTIKFHVGNALSKLGFSSRKSCGCGTASPRAPRYFK